MPGCILEGGVISKEMVFIKRSIAASTAYFAVVVLSLCSVPVEGNQVMSYMLRSILVIMGRYVWLHCVCISFDDGSLRWCTRVGVH